MLNKLFKIVTFLLVPCLVPLNSFASEILSIRHWAAPEHTRVVVDISDEAVYSVDKTAQSVSIHFKDTTMREPIQNEIIVNQPGLQEIVVSSPDEKSCRIDLSLSNSVSTKVFNLKPFLDKPHRVVIDIELPEVEKKESKERAQVRAQRKDKVIIIDAGHGGEDPGAVGRKRTREKDVVLSIAKKLQKKINSRPGYSAFLTRSGDYYPSFKKRLQIAGEYGADLFISIHADASRNRKARGSSVYCLSTRGASNEAAKILARNENLADIIGGAEAAEANPEESDPIMLDMVQTETLNLSKTLASHVLNNLRDINPLKFQRVQEAPFRVLKLPHIPSVLVETAYISNPREEALLRNNDFQERLVDSLAAAIFDFLKQPAEEKTEPEIIEAGDDEPEEAVEGDEAPAPPKIIRYKVKRGDTLDKIAKKHNTTIAALLKLNNMRLEQPLFVDRNLKIAAPRGTPDQKTAEPTLEDAIKAVSQKSVPARPVYYTVKNGDTLEKIARKHNTTLSKLLKLNRMKLHDQLPAGRKIKVSTPPGLQGAGAPAEKRAGEKKQARIYRVKRGDALEKIANENSTTVKELLELNNMKLRDPLYANRRIKLPPASENEEQPAAAKKPAKPKKSVAYYVVKRGDTLDKIARKHHTTISAIAKLNRLNPDDPLYVNRKLRISAE